MDNKDSGKMLRVRRILDLGGRASSMAARLQMPFFEDWRGVESRGSMDGAYFFAVTPCMGNWAASLL